MYMLNQDTAGTDWRWAEHETRAFGNKNNNQMSYEEIQGRKQN
jgi:hypothetical protein